MSYMAKSIWLLEPANYTSEIRHAMETFYKSWLPLHSKEDDIYLYHYTTLSGLQGILTNRMFWSSHSSSFNDPSELQYGKQLVKEELRKAKNYEDRREITKMLDELLNYVDVYDTILYHNFVTCFCESGNLLSQWRGYADDGGGFSIGVTFSTDTSFFHEIDNLKDTSYLILRKVIYEPAKQKTLISKYIQSLIEASNTALNRFESSTYGIPTTWSVEAALQAINIFIELIISFKNPAFQEEAEWRLIKVIQASHKPELCHFRDTKSGLIPYLHTYICEKKDVHKFPLHQIRFGPLLDPSQTKSSLELLVHRLSKNANPIMMDANTISISDAGYRIRR